MESDNRELKWIQTNASFLLLSCHHLAEWEGSAPPSGGRIVEASFHFSLPEEPATDYDRACDVDGYVGVISVGQSDAIVLNDDAYSTMWWSESGNSGFLVRWCYANSNAEVIAALRQPTAIIWEDSGLVFTLDEPPLLLFDSTETATEILGDSLELPLTAGVYRIETAFYKPNPELYLLLHQFVPACS
jgi:hypothetical protein